MIAFISTTLLIMGSKPAVSGQMEAPPLRRTA